MTRIEVSLLVSCVLLSQRAEAQEVRWDAPSECPIADNAAHEQAQTTTVEGVPEVRVESYGSGFRAVIQLAVDGRLLTREVSAATCDEVNRAAWIALSLLQDGMTASDPVDADPASVEGSAPSSSTTTQAPASFGEIGDTPPAPAQAEARDPAQTPRRVTPTALPATPPPLVSEQTPPRLFLGLSTSAGIEGLELWTGGLGLQFGARSGQWLGMLQVAALLPLEPVHEQGVDLDMRFGDVRAQLCRVTRGRLWTGVCAAGLLTLLWARSGSISTPLSDSVWLPGLGVDGTLGFAWSNHWDWVADVRLSVRAHRVGFDVIGPGRLFELGTTSAQIWVGPRLSF